MASSSLWRKFLPLPEPRSRPQAPIQVEASRPVRASTGDEIPVSLSDRWYVLGVTGSGKTKFAKQLVRELRRLFPRANLYALDSKGGGDFDGWPGQFFEQEPPPALVGEGGVQVWQPPDDDTQSYDDYLSGILKARQPAILLIDELSSLGGNSGNSFPPALGRLQKQGRKLGICTITLTQEGAYIPRQVSKQASHFVYFRLSRDDDHGIAQAARLLGLPIPHRDEPAPEPTEPFGFFYRRLLPTPGALHEYTGLHEFFGLDE